MYFTQNPRGLKVYLAQKTEFSEPIKMENCNLKGNY